MTSVTVSPKYQVVIPKKIRESMQIRPGEKLQVISFESRIELVPIRPIKEIRAIFKGLDSSFDRDADDRV